MLVRLNEHLSVNVSTTFPKNMLLFPIDRLIQKIKKGFGIIWYEFTKPLLLLNLVDLKGIEPLTS